MPSFICPEIDHMSRWGAGPLPQPPCSPVTARAHVIASQQVSEFFNRHSWINVIALCEDRSVSPTDRSEHPDASSAIRTSVHTDSFDIYRKTCSKVPAWLFMNLFYASDRFAEALNLYPTECMGYLLQSISALNQSIARYPDVVDDSTIATVACLANIEVCRRS